MADKTKYYYLKIKEGFFDTEDMKLLESMDNGYLYSNILMKMYLLSLKNNGKLMFKDKIPYNSKMLSTILNHNVDVLDKAIMVFKELNLIDVLDSGAIFMLDIQNFIGKSSDEADRIRNYRNKITNEKNDLLQMYENCTTNCANIKDRDKDKDKDITKDKDKDITKDKKRYFDNDSLNDIFIEFLQVRKKLKAVNSERAINSLLNKLKNYDDETKYKMIEQSIVHSWKDVYELKSSDKKIEQSNNKNIEPQWFNKENKEDKVSEEELEEMQKLLNEMTM